MKRKILTLLIAFTTAFTYAAFVSSPATLQAQTPKDAACQGLELTGAPAGCAQDPNQPSVESTLATVINILSWVVGVAAVIMIIIGGFKYIVSGGNEAGVNSAKNTILFAIIGLVIVAVAQVLVQFVINRATDAVAPPTP